MHHKKDTNTHIELQQLQIADGEANFARRRHRRRRPRRGRHRW